MRYFNYGDRTGFNEGATIIQVLRYKGGEG